MECFKISTMKGGWFIGNFEPSLYKTKDVEVAVKTYKKGDCENAHYHKIATEYTVIVKGKVRMKGMEYQEGDVIVVNPGEATDFYAIEDSINVVVKIPGANSDKYIVEEEL